LTGRGQEKSVCLFAVRSLVIKENKEGWNMKITLEVSLSRHYNKVGATLIEQPLVTTEFSSDAAKAEIGSVFKVLEDVCFKELDRIDVRNEVLK
jgi:hypothetical protein